MSRTPTTTDRDGLVKLDGNFFEPSWKGTHTATLRGDFCFPKQGQSSYFMAAPDGSCSKQAPWIRKAEGTGWDVILEGTVLETLRTKSDAQIAAKSLLDI